jgi:hypothetical protein
MKRPSGYYWLRDYLGEATIGKYDQGYGWGILGEDSYWYEYDPDSPREFEKAFPVIGPKIEQPWF